MGKKSCQICCCVSVILVIIVAGVFTILALTVFKPKQPSIVAKPVGFERFRISGFPPNVNVNVTLIMVITINNPNHSGTFKFRNTTAYVDYHGVIVGEVTIQAAMVLPHSLTNITAPMDLMADKLIESPYLLPDFITGSLNFTSTALLHGKVKMFRIFKFGAKAFSTCDISVVISNQDIETNCRSKIKL